MSIRKISPFLIGFSILGLVVLLGARSNEARTSGVSRETLPRTVRVAEVETTSGTTEVRFPGITRSARHAELAFTLPGRVASRSVDVGDRVAAGQILATLDDREYRFAERSASASVAEIGARLDQARREEARVARLAEAEAATAEELERAGAGTATLRAARDAAEARHRDTRRLLEESRLAAPFAGTVSAVRIEPGEWASPGESVVEVAGDGALEIRIEVPESIRARIVPGSEVQIDLPMLDHRVTGEIRSVAGAATGRGALFPVIVSVGREGGLVSGLAAEVILPLAADRELSVPLAAVIDSGSSRPSVFRIDEGRAERIRIEPGRVVGDRLTVTATDLASGDEVAVRGHASLIDGDLVEVR